MVCWDRLIRFIATDGRELRGEPIMPTPDFDLGSVSEATQLRARVITGSDIYDDTGATKVTNEIVTVRRLLGPLAQNDVDIIRCVGLNYGNHSKLSSLPVEAEVVCILIGESPRIRSNSTTLSIHLHQTKHQYPGPRRRPNNPPNRPRQPSRLRRRIMYSNRQRREEHSTRRSRGLHRRIYMRQ